MKMPCITFSHIIVGNIGPPDSGTSIILGEITDAVTAPIGGGTTK